MTSLEEFSFIAAQLQWLEARLRQQPPPVDDARLEGALNALSCARAVIDQLAHIGSMIHDAPNAAGPDGLPPADTRSASSPA